MRIYIAGPMSGLPELNFPAFNLYAKRFRKWGHDVENPAEMEHGDARKEWGYYLKRDLAVLLTCDAVAVLPGWLQSKGALLETSVARMVNIPVLDVRTLRPVTESVLEEAQRLVYGAREESYGHPREDLSRTAKMWEGVLDAQITPPQVALCMLLVKVSRECHAPKRDNRTDMAGYAAVLDRLYEP